MASKALKHMATSIVPAIYNPHLADRNLEIETEAAYAMARRLAREEGLLVGISAAAAWLPALRVAEGGKWRRPRSRHRHRSCRLRRKVPERALLGRGRMVMVDLISWSPVVDLAR